MDFRGPRKEHFEVPENNSNPSFGFKHYVPILKAKRGETRALASLSSARRADVTPLLEISPDTSPKRFKKALVRELVGLGSDWPFFVDLLYYPIVIITKNGTKITTLPSLFAELRKAGSLAIPCTDLSRDSAYQTQVAKIISKDRRGACVRLYPEDFADLSQLQTRLTNLLSQLALTPEETHIVIETRDAIVPTFATFLVDSLPLLPQWRTVTLSACAYPQDLKMTANSTKSFPRSDWDQWNKVRATRSTRVPSFSDYGVLYWFPQVASKFMNAPGKMRYTTDTVWQVSKGVSFRNNGNGQMVGICAAISSSPGFRGSAFSGAEKWIEDCGTKAVSAGNPEGWVAISTLQHLEFAADQISKI